MKLATLPRDDKPIPGPVDVVVRPLNQTEQLARFDRYIVPEFDFVDRISRRMSMTKSDADDLKQDALANAYRAIARFDGRYPRAWLYRIVSNAAASRARRSRATLVSIDSDLAPSAQLQTESAGPEDIIIDPVIDPVLTNALEELPNHYRDVVGLVDVRGLSYEAAAMELDIPRGTVMSRLHRGRRRLRETLAGTHLDRAARVAVETSVPV